MSDGVSVFESAVLTEHLLETSMAMPLAPQLDLAMGNTLATAWLERGLEP